MQEFAINLEETIDAKRQLYVQEAGDEVRRCENASGTMVNHLESQLQTQSVEPRTQNTFHEAVESERHRLQNQEPFLSDEARRREYLHQQEEIDMQKQFDQASKQRQGKFKNRSEETVTLRREIDKSGKFSESMLDWTASEQLEEVRLLKTNNISLHGSPPHSKEIVRSSHAEPRFRL